MTRYRMSKITFRADADLVERVEALDASKSEVMRRALRAYLDDDASETASDATPGSLDALLDARIDERVDERVARRLDEETSGDVTVNVNVGETADTPAGSDSRVREADSANDAAGPVSDATTAEASDARACPQCGESLAAEHAFCPNCGERAGGRPACECGAELRSDWAFCPDCGRRTMAGDVLDR
ncbi:Arc/MetJ-type ribon-helix-helix transcriptional regulator/RNA polymerase subunit RPABC4/transcription elongation factor Spt4 [Halarchaeum rubridurum]|nr:Arc/MetJ-type ribon-helix-helix transcriptional regulator/RNA polymerase subunit RPABC4/transcription elongation factor Spt4 [Halarchaeum rubridurum]